VINLSEVMDVTGVAVATRREQLPLLLLLLMLLLLLWRCCVGGDHLRS
jgi:hypothetical protein